ncbi:hypothetical protein P8452_05019 [Trifolium repens]|nr:hypothetical protein P8452_05019 [Trifolium repens]
MLHFKFTILSIIQEFLSVCLYNIRQSFFKSLTLRKQLHCLIGLAKGKIISNFQDLIMLSRYKDNDSPTMSFKQTTSGFKFCRSNRWEKLAGMFY